MPDLQYETNPFNAILRCQVLAENNRQNFYEEIVKSGKATVKSYVSLFKSGNEEEEVNSWGITKLRTATKTMAKSLGKDMQKDINLELKSSDKEKVREVYWRVFNLVEEEDGEILTEITEKQ